MFTVLIAHANVGFATALAESLSAGGFHTITCPGPWPPALRCIRCDVGYCPLTEGTDVMIYDPTLVGRDAEGREYSLAIDSARAHPDVPLLLAWEGERPAQADDVLRAVPGAQVVSVEPDALVAQVARVVAALPRPVAV